MDGARRLAGDRRGPRAGGEDPVLRRVGQRLPAGQRPRPGPQRPRRRRPGHLQRVPQEPEEQLLPACARHGVGVIVRVALDDGGLTGRITPETVFPAGDFRNGYFGGDRKAQVKQHADALSADLGIGDGQLAEVALRYVLSHEAVSTVIAGMRTVQNVERNAATGDGRGLDPAQRDIVARHRWERNFYQS